jgi:hypothetical protein
MLAMSGAPMFPSLSAVTRFFRLCVCSSLPVQECRYMLRSMGGSLLILLASAQGVLVGDAFAQAIDPAVRTAAAAGPVRVIVELRISPPFTPEGNLPSPAAVEEQRRAIAKTQDDLIASLAGTSFSVARKFDGLPMMALEIGADALARLEVSGMLVTRVLEDAPRFRQP